MANINNYSLNINSYYNYNDESIVWKEVFPTGNTCDIRFACTEEDMLTFIEETLDEIGTLLVFLGVEDITIKWKNLDTNRGDVGFAMEFVSEKGKTVVEAYLISLDD